MAGRPKSGQTNHAQFKAAQLRQSILQAAVQGKLAPQNLHDEPASMLLERIRAEKARLAKEGKIKKEKPLPPITEDEIPYDLPDGWVWCRLGEIAVLITSGSREWAQYYSKSGAIFLGMGNLSKDSFKLRLHSIQHVLPPSNTEGKRTQLESHDILVSITGEVGTLGYILPNFGEAYINQHTALVRLPREVQGEFFPFTFLSPFCKEQFNTPQRGIKNSFRLTDLAYLLIALPPLAEQQRVVAKVNELMAMCDELEAAEKELDKLEANFAEYLPKSILQAAVQGKLVPQNIHDEPASKLLERIRAEKARLVKEGKVKKEKPLLPITEDEIPYDLPEGWVWCRFGELFSLISGRDLETKQFNDKAEGVPYITGASSISNEQLIVTRWTKKPSVTSILGDLLISCKGTIGKLALNTVGDCHIARQIMALRGYSKNIIHAYIKIFLHHHVQTLLIQAKSIIPGISRDDILLSLFPLPPLAEQQRIVAKVDELMILCEQLKRVSDLPIVQLIALTPTVAQDLLDEEPELLMAARGRASQQDSKELQQAQEDLFGE